MKNLFFLFLFAALTLPAIAQRNDFVIDTAQTVNIGGLFYKDLYQIREDGTGNIPERKIIGDSTGYYNSQLTEHVDASRAWAAIAYKASQSQKLRKTLNNLQRETLTNVGKNIADSLKVIFADSYLNEAGWTWKEGNNALVNITVSKSANGNIRASGLPGAAGFITMRIESDRHFEFRNYPVQGTHTVMVTDNGRVFRNVIPGVGVTFKKQ